MSDSSDTKVTVDPESGKMLFNESALPELVKALKTQTPMETEAKEAALKMSGLALSYFDTINNSSMAVRTAVTRTKLQSEMEHVLESPEKAMKAAEYVEALHKGSLTNNRLLWKRNEEAALLWSYLPDLAVDVDAKGTLTKICFGTKPYIFETNPSPVNAICAERKEK